MRDQAMIESIKMGRKKLELGYPILPLKESKTKQEQFAKELNYNMITMKLNRAIMQLRHLNPELYKIVNHLWKNEIG